jgi:hypothetical protein
VHTNYDTWLGSQVILNSNGIYQYQSGASYFSIGGSLGYLFPQEETDVIINAGLWYWSGNAVVPYIGFSYQNFQIGMSYDATVSKLNEAAKRSNTFELSLILRGGTSNNEMVVPTPWK